MEEGRLLCALPSGIFDSHYAGSGSGHIRVMPKFPNAKDFNLKGFIRMSTVSMLIVACGVLALLYGAYAIRSVLAAPAGTARMQEIAAAVQEGANAYLNRQYTAIAVAGLAIGIILGLLEGTTVAIGFFIGAVLSGAAGYIGMNVSVRANVRTAEAARSEGLAEGLNVAFKSGAITGMLVAGLALLGVVHGSQ